MIPKPWLFSYLVQHRWLLLILLCNWFMLILLFVFTQYTYTCVLSINCFFLFHSSDESVLMKSCCFRFRCIFCINDYLLSYLISFNWSTSYHDLNQFSPSYSVFWLVFVCIFYARTSTSDMFVCHLSHTRI